MRLGGIAVTAFVLLFIACSPVSRIEDGYNDRVNFHIDLDKTSRSTVLSSENSPSIELQSDDRTSLKMLVGYSTQVTGLCNAYLSSMDEFFRSFRNYYQSIYKFGEDGSTKVTFEKTNLIPKLSEKQKNLEEQFQAVDFLSSTQNDYVIRSLSTLQKRLSDLDALSSTLSTYVGASEYKSDVDLQKGQELLMKMNDHCAQFYQTHKELSNFIEDLQFAGRSQLLAEESDGEAAINVLSDLRNLKGLVQRLGDFRVESDDLHDLTEDYKGIVTELKKNIAYPVEKISDEKTRNDYRVMYNSIVSQILPLVNKVIYELETENVEWVKSDFNETMETIFKSYNDLSRFYAEGYGKPVPLGN